MTNTISLASIATFFGPALVLPILSKTFTCSNTLACHALYNLTYKIQERAFKYFFPETPAPFLQPPSLLSRFVPITFKVLNSCLATGTSFLILNQIRAPALAKVLINYRLFMIGFPLVNFAISISSIIILVVALRTYRMIRSYLYPIQKPQMTITQENVAKAKEIKNLIKSLGSNLDELNIVKENKLYLIDKVSLSFPSLPIREKDNSQHIWDITETIDPLITAAINKGEDPKCPNGCGKKLELEVSVNTAVQDEIIALLKKHLGS